MFLLVLMTLLLTVGCATKADVRRLSMEHQGILQELEMQNRYLREIETRQGDVLLILYELNNDDTVEVESVK